MNNFSDEEREAILTKELLEKYHFQISHSNIKGGKIIYQEWNSIKGQKIPTIKWNNVGFYIDTSDEQYCGLRSSMQKDPNRRLLKTFGDLVDVFNQGYIKLSRP